MSGELHPTNPFHCWINNDDRSRVEARDVKSASSVHAPKDQKMGPPLRIPPPNSRPGVPPPIPARTRPPPAGRGRPPPPPRPRARQEEPLRAVPRPVFKHPRVIDIPEAVEGTPPPLYSELYPSQIILRRYSHGGVDEPTKLPPPRPHPPNRKMSEGNLPSGGEMEGYKFKRDPEYKFNHKRGASVKLPPPIRTDPPEPIEEPTPVIIEEKISQIGVRQDSNVSSDSFSQTSSPSYTTKSMEAPLLPRKKFSCDRSKEVGPIQLANEETGVSEDPNTSPITKSHSTPASLQTIVRFHNGSNMSLHHKIIRDIRRPSTHYTRGKLRFQFIQIILNAIAIMAIAGGLAAYFKAYPTTVRYVNRTVTTTKVTFIQQDVNPAPGLCLPVIVTFCKNHKVPYNFTMFPNYIGHFNQREASQELEVYDAVVDVRCYELAALFLCTVFVPKCGPEGQIVRPCRSLCLETKRRCGFFLEVFGLTLPEYLDCDLFPESEDPDTCLGHKEVLLAERRAHTPSCINGFQCDQKRCIPEEWRCDGHVDCEDQSDELNCKNCAEGMIHCGENRCIAQSHMCDGDVNCPMAQDERNCMRLSERMGDEGYGKLEVFQPDTQLWKPACVKNWDPVISPRVICQSLGYKDVKSSNVTNTPQVSSKVPDSSMMRFHNKRKRTNLLKELRSCSHAEAYPTVDLFCKNIECGQRRQPLTQPSTRIIGGTESTPGDWPFLAALLGGPEQVFYCAGVLISDQWVLTASHCVGNLFSFSHGDTSGWTIQLGITRRHAHSYFGQKAKVKRVVPHPMYNVGIAHDNDVALFQLQQRVTFHEHLLPVCLPSPHDQLRPGTMCTVIGWGKREDTDASEYEPAVNEVKVPVLNRTVCNKWLEPRDLNVTQGMICAGYEAGGKDACQGDSGGPLLCPSAEDPTRWFVGGIVSWGIKCAHPRLPGVYAYVPHYVSWIRQQIALYSD